MLGEAELRLEDGRVGELVDRSDTAIGAVVEAAVDADRPVDTVHHAHLVAREPPQAAEVEVERVVEARRRPAREPVLLHGESTPFKLADEREQELVTAAVRRPVELVEHGDDAAEAARGDPVALGLRTPQHCVYEGSRSHARDRMSQSASMYCPQLKSRSTISRPWTPRSPGLESTSSSARSNASGSPGSTSRLFSTTRRPPRSTLFPYTALAARARA